MKDNKKQKTYKFLYDHMGNRKINFVFSVIFAVISVICEMIPFYFVANMIDELIKEDGIYKTFIKAREKAVSWKIA